MKDERQKKDLIQFFADNPELPIWEAIKQWSGHRHIITWDGNEYDLWAVQRLGVELVKYEELGR